MRWNKGALFIVGTALVACVLFAAFLLLDSSIDIKNIKADVRASSGSLLTGADPRVGSAPVKIEEYVVKGGDTWGQIVEEVDFDPKLGESLRDSAKDVHDLSTIRAGRVFRFYFNENTTELLKLEYDTDDKTILIIEKDERGGFFARKAETAYDIEIVTKRGVIESSLFETASEIGISPTVILNLATIFGWDIDFASNVQPKDSFVIAYEERSRDGKYVGPGKIFAARFSNSGTDFYAFLYEDPDGTPRYYNKEGMELRRQFLRSPLDYTRITSGFSYNRFHPILNTFTTHRAIDYAAAEGTPVSVTADGTATFVGWHGGNGKFIEVKHANGYRTGYAHLSSYGKGVTSGTKVRQNQVIGFVGSTGLSTGPHLHYEMRKDGILINPLGVNLPPGKKLAGENLDAFLMGREKLLKLIGEL